MIRLGDRRWRIRGLSKNTGFEQLKINVLCGRAEGFFVDTLDLYSARQRAAFVRETAVETGQKEEAVKKDLGKVFLKLEELRDEAIRCALEPQKKEVMLSPEEREEAMEFLKDPNLLSRILAILNVAGWLEKRPTSSRDTSPRYPESSTNPWPLSSGVHPPPARRCSWSRSFPLSP